MDDSTVAHALLPGSDVHTRLVASRAGELVEEDGWFACVLPYAPHSSILNCVVGVPDVERAQAIYEQAGREVGCVARQREGTSPPKRLEDAGLILDSVPVVMGVELDAMDLEHTPETRPVDLRTLGAINDRAYGYEDGRLERTLAAVPATEVDPHAVYDGGEPVAVTFILDVEDDASVGWVATLSHARRRGLATGVLSTALRRAKERGRTTTTLWASAMGSQVYERLGYRTLGHLHLWGNGGRERPPPRLAEPRAGRGAVLPALRRAGGDPLPALAVVPDLRLPVVLEPQPGAGGDPRRARPADLAAQARLRPGQGAVTFPGGFVDLGESVEEAAAREAREEIGIDVELTGLVGVYSRPEQRVVLIVYTAIPLGQPRVSDEATRRCTRSRPRTSPGTGWPSGAPSRRSRTTCGRFPRSPRRRRRTASPPRTRRSA